MRRWTLVASALLLVLDFGAEALGIEPRWIDVRPLRDLGNRWRGGRVLSDIECRMPAGHQYAFPSMPMTWAHESTHGLNSSLRMAEYRKARRKVNALYCLDGRAVVIDEPKGRLSAVARSLPRGLRGVSFQLYFGRQLQWWDTTPSYCLDEWVAYTNGSLCGREVREHGWHYELLQAINFSIYALAMAQEVTASDPTYDHEQLREFIAWNALRTMTIYRELIESGGRGTHVEGATRYLATFLGSEEARGLRDFARKYLGEEKFQEIFQPK